jgi:hypothetical protein
MSWHARNLTLCNASEDAVFNVFRKDGVDAKLSASAEGAM